MPTLEHSGERYKPDVMPCTAPARPPTQGPGATGEASAQKGGVFEAKNHAGGICIKLRRHQVHFHTFQVFPNNGLILKKTVPRGIGYGRSITNYGFPSGSHAGVGVTQMALVPVVSQAHSSKPFMDRQSLCYLNGYTGGKK